MTLTEITGLWWVKPAAIALGVFVCSGGSFYSGWHWANTVSQAAVTKKIVTQVKYMPQETKIIHDTQIKTQIVYKTLEKVIHDLPNDSACDLSPDALGVWNSSRSLSPLPRPDATSTATTTNNP